MCKLSNLYVLDLFSDISSGAIEFNVANSLPRLLNAPCKLIVKQMQIELHDSASTDFTGYVNLRVVHNMITQSGTNNFNGSNTSNVLSFINNFSIRNNPDNQHQLSYSETDLKMYLPNGLPSVLLLNRRGSDNVVPLNDVSCDRPTLSWAVKLEITVNPDDE